MGIDSVVFGKSQTIALGLLCVFDAITAHQLARIIHTKSNARYPLNGLVRKGMATRTVQRLEGGRRVFCYRVTSYGRYFRAIMRAASRVKLIGTKIKFYFTRLPSSRYPVTASLKPIHSASTPLIP